MKKGEEKENRSRAIIITLVVVFGVVFLVFPILFAIFGSDASFGNVALIPIEGPITVGGQRTLGESSVSSTSTVQFIKEAEENPTIEAIVLSINSPGGSAVASDEIAQALKHTTKPTIALIREVGASGGYWIASATDHIIANRMSITGSIGVISSYLEFSGLMKEYGVGYERLVSGKFKDVGTPFKKLDASEKALLQGKIDTIHDYFVDEIAQNRNLEKDLVAKLATGEFFLGSEALEYGLVDELGNEDTVKEYLIQQHNLSGVDFVVYQQEETFWDILTSVFENFSFKIGEGFGAAFLKVPTQILLT